ncbi:MAG: MBL fold metallo-hydrolase [Chlamydiae bacterium]|nr:MBL fold metallo-hydrolase [Chlamydiota bacterium]
MIVERVTSGPCETNAYLVISEKTKKSFVVDVPPDSAALLEKKAKDRGCSIEAIFLTHSHWDHMADAALLRKMAGANIYVHPLDAPNLQHPGTDKLPMFFAIQGAEPDLFLQEGDRISIGDLTLLVIATPGHTPGGVSLFLEKERVLFSGDTLFQGTMGRIDFPTSHPSSMWDSLTRLSTLPPETKVFAGHGEPTTIGKESWIRHAKERFS